MFSDSFLFDFDSYMFGRPMLEKNGYYAQEKDGKLFVLLNVLGVDKQDIVVDTDLTPSNQQILRVSGKTHDEVFNKDFTVRMNFILKNPMKSVDWTLKNGFMVLEISFVEPVKPSIKITSK